MAEVLIIANRGQYNHRIWRTLRYLGCDAQLASNTLSVEEVRSLDPKGIVVGGGPYLEETGNTGEIVLTFAGKIPILGICLGHQLLAQLFGGEVRSAEIGEYAETEILVDEEDVILRGLKPSFRAWVSHKDEIVTLPGGFHPLAHSSTCRIEAMAHEGKSLYGLQFHPEVEHTPRGPEIFRNFLEACGVSPP
jgi:GMP synthase (glutamine-hydrolysing)